MRTQMVFGALAALAVLAAPAAPAKAAEAAPNPTTQREFGAKLLVCNVCHGDNGVPKSAAIPIISGQQETYLWIIEPQHVLKSVVRCWASLFTPQALAYRAHRNISSADLAMGVVVQCMVPAEAAGVMLTIDPVNGDRSAIVIEAAYGLGVAVVNGEVTPDRLCVDKVLLEIRSRSIGAKSIAYRFEQTIQGIRLEPVPAEEQTRPSVTDDEVIQLASLGKRMERVLGRPQDMEWAIGPGQSRAREVFLLQSRPETIWSQRTSAPLSAAGTTVMDRILQTMVGSRTTMKGDLNLGHHE